MRGPPLTSYPTPTLPRRSLLAALGATGVAVAAPGPIAAAQSQDRPQHPPLLDVLPPIPVQANLFTRVAAEVMINGRGPFVFVIDTGAGSTAIADSVVAQLGLPARGPLIVHGITSAARTDSVQVDRLTLSGLGFRNLRCPVISRRQLGADGLLGLDVLGQFRLGFDTERQSVHLRARGIRIVMGGEQMSTGSRIRRNGVHSVRGRFGQLILTQTQVEGLPTAAFIDSGAQYSIGNNALRRAVAARRPDGLGPSRPVQLYGVTGQTLSAGLAQVDQVRLGGTRLGATLLLFADLHCFETLELADRPALLIGADLLGRFRAITLDFPANTVDFQGLRRRSTRTIEDELLL